MIAYKYLIWMTLLIFGVSGGWLGWWHASKSLYVRNLGAEVLGDTNIKPDVLLRRQVRRILWTAAGVAAGLVAGMFALTSLTRFQT